MEFEGRKTAPAAARGAMRNSETIPAPVLRDGLAAARKSRWLSSQPAVFQDQMLRHAAVQKFPKGETIIGYEEKASGLYLLLRGAVEVSIPRGNHELAPVHIITGLQWFGEGGAFAGRASAAEFRASSPVAVLSISRLALSAIDVEPRIWWAAAADLMALAAQGYMQVAGDLLNAEVDERVRARLLSLSEGIPPATPGGAAEIVVPLGQDDLATLACVSRASVSKILRGLESLGIIRTGYRKIVILRRGALADGGDPFC